MLLCHPRGATSAEGRLRLRSAQPERSLAAVSPVSEQLALSAVEQESPRCLLTLSGKLPLLLLPMCAAPNWRHPRRSDYHEEVVDSESVWFFQARMVIPHGAVGLQERLLRVAHDGMRHASPANTLRSLRRIPFTWAGITASVTKWCKSCLMCATRKQRDMAARHGLMQRAIGTYPGMRWGMDFVGELSESTSGNRYILVLTDAFSGFTILVATPEQSGERVVEILEQRVFSVFGAPQFLSHDSGKPLDCNLVDDLCMR